MGRLIDADLLISQASKYHMFDYVTIKGLVDQQPTAYDVDSVIEQLGARAKEYTDNHDIFGKAVIRECVAIVRGAVKDE